MRPEARVVCRTSRGGGRVDQGPGVRRDGFDATIPRMCNYYICYVYVAMVDVFVISGLCISTGRSGFRLLALVTAGL